MTVPPAPSSASPSGTPAAADPGPPGWLDRLDDRLQRHRVTAVVSAVLAKWYDDGAGRLANLLAYSAFLAVFPMLLILLTLVEILLVGHTTAQQDVIDAALRQFPEIGSELRANINGLGDRSGVFLVVVLLWLVYGCLRLSRNAQVLMATVWSVSREALPTFGRWLPRAVGFLVILGVGFIAGGVISGCRHVRRTRPGLGTGGLRRIAGGQRRHVLGWVRRRPVRAGPRPHGLAGRGRRRRRAGRCCSSWTPCW